MRCHKPDCSSHLHRTPPVWQCPLLSTQPELDTRRTRPNVFISAYLVACRPVLSRPPASKHTRLPEGNRRPSEPKQASPSMQNSERHISCLITYKLRLLPQKRQDMVVEPKICISPLVAPFSRTRVDQMYVSEQSHDAVKSTAMMVYPINLVL